MAELPQMRFFSKKKLQHIFDFNFGSFYTANLRNKSIELRQSYTKKLGLYGLNKNFSEKLTT